MEVFWIYGFNSDRLSKLNREMIDRKVKQLKQCETLGDMHYGHIHPLRKFFSGMYAVRVNQLARLIIIPIVESPEVRELRGKKFLKNVRKVLIFYSMDHYKTYMKKKKSSKFGKELTGIIG